MEKNIMKIPEQDFIALTSMVEFHFKFSEYIKENNPDLFYRAVDYAKTFTSSDKMKFEYWHEDTPRFLEELSKIIMTREMKFTNYVNKIGDAENAKSMWMKKKKTTKDDHLGLKSYIDNFVHHSNKLNYDSFDASDWDNYIKIAMYVNNNEKFTNFAISQVSRVLGEDSLYLKELKNNGKN